MEVLITPVIFRGGRSGSPESQPVYGLIVPKSRDSEEIIDAIKIYDFSI